MPYDRDAEFAKMATNLQEKTGKSIDEWKTLAQKSGLEKHGELVNFLKSEYGLTHGYANMVVNDLKSSAYTETDSDVLLEALFKGAKAATRPIYEQIVATINDFGNDSTIIPMKAYVSLRRNKQFACIKPATANRVDLGIKLKGVQAGGRLEEGGFNGMVSHTVKIGSIDEVDSEVVSWLKQAYEGA